MSFQDRILQQLGNRDIHSIRPLALAYLGDTIYDLYLRGYLVATSEKDTHYMHERASHFANAASQAKLIALILPDLTEEELTVFKHARNQKIATLPKNQSPVDYKNATGLEALLGYLYLQGDEDRILQLLDIGMKRWREGEINSHG